MKKIGTLILLLLPSCFLSAQLPWTWLQGDPYTPVYGIYGTKGVTNTINQPGKRNGEASWKDSEGNIWILGGNGYARKGNGYLNDFWKYTPASGLWTWMGGDDTENQFGVYGTKGTASSSNKIRARSGAATWTDAQGNLWLFGGRGYDASLPSFVNIYFNDLWKYTPSTGLWTWMSGDTAYNVRSVVPGVFGTKGTAAPLNKPATRTNASAWADTSGNLWLYGGTGVGSMSTSQTGPYFGTLTDVWKYTPSTGLWTWMSGDTLINQPGVYGTKGLPDAANKPGTRYNVTNWTDLSGRFWLFGGRVDAGNLNDLWMFSPSSLQWTWVSGSNTVNAPGMYGAKGTPSPATGPGARYGAVGWTDPSGDLWLYNGSNAVSSNNYSIYYNDVWKFSIPLNQWTWMGGDTITTNRLAIYGQKGVPSDSSHPASAIFTTAWSDTSGNLWLFGGYNFTGVISPYAQNNVWKYTPASSRWTWVNGDTATTTLTPPVYGTRGTASAGNTPGDRSFGSSWMDAAHDLWLFGGRTLINDLWKYSPANNQWTWVGGDTLQSAKNVYGTKGIPADNNWPRTRSGAATWVDAAGNFWLFGGSTNGNQIQYFQKNDLWKYTPSTGRWTWISGDTTDGQPGVLGIKGVASPTNKPGSRADAVAWTDKSGNLWLFGGLGYSTRDFGILNELWKYDPSTNLWTWVAGDSSPDFASYVSFGTKGVPSINNHLNGRYGAAGWADSSGNLWLFGGIGHYSNVADDERYFNDLWKYDQATNIWTWMSGDNSYNQKGLYGERGVAGSNHKPGSRRHALTWADGAGNLYLFGGNNDTAVNSSTRNVLRYYNDVWKYGITTSQWTWLGGDSTINPSGTYGALGVTSSANKPGGRDGTMSWSDGSGSLWLYGGYGYPDNGTRALNDLMKLSPAASLPVQFSNFTAVKQQQLVVLYWSTAQEQNSRSFMIERSADGIVYNKIGTVAAAGTAATRSSYGFTDLAPLPSYNFYRLKEVDLDDKFMYSSVVKIYMGDEAAGFTLGSNPVQHELQVSLQVPSEQRLQLLVRDAGGRLWMTKEYRAIKGSNVYRLPVGALPTGTYFIQASSPSLQGTKSFIKQ